jgi:hypothetical protein
LLKASGAYDPDCYFTPTERGGRRIVAIAKGFVENLASHDVAEYLLGEVGMGLAIGWGTVQGYNDANAQMDAETRACLHAAQPKN